MRLWRSSKTEPQASACATFHRMMHHRGPMTRHANRGIALARAMFSRTSTVFCSSALSGFLGLPVRKLRAITVASLLIGTCTNAYAAGWTQWGGPTRDFKVPTTGLAERWPENGPKRLWTRPLGKGYSAITVADGKLYTLYQDGDNDVVVAMRADTGKTVWEYRSPASTFPKQRLDFGKGPNSTPLVHDDRVITIGFTGKMHCLSLDKGKLIWSRDLVGDFDGKRNEFGYSPSPIMYKSAIITLVGGEKTGVVALDPKDGCVIWKSEPHDISYASPIVINVDGQDQIVFFSSTEVIGLDASNGHTLWRHPCKNRYKNNATDPIWAGDNLLWVATQTDGGTRVLKLTQRDGKTDVKEVWFNGKVKLFHWNAICIGDYVYASIGGTTTMLSAINIKTGEIAWRERGFHKALCVYADKKLILLDEKGQLALAKVSPEGIDIRSKVQLLKTEDVAWTVPTLVGKTLYIRDNENILALDLG